MRSTRREETSSAHGNGGRSGLPRGTRRSHRRSSLRSFCRWMYVQRFGRLTSVAPAPKTYERRNSRMRVAGTSFHTCIPSFETLSAGLPSWRRSARAASMLPSSAERLSVGKFTVCFVSFWNEIRICLPAPIFIREVTPILECARMIGASSRGVGGFGWSAYFRRSLRSSSSTRARSAKLSASTSST